GASVRASIGAPDAGRATASSTASREGAGAAPSTCCGSSAAASESVRASVMGSSIVPRRPWGARSRRGWREGTCAYNESWQVHVPDQQDGGDDVEADVGEDARPEAAEPVGEEAEDEA